MAILTTNATSFAEFADLLQSSSKKKIGHNTYAQRNADGIGILLHSTFVATFHDDETITLNSDGWRTVTTKDRINSVLPIGLRVWSEQGVWTLSRVGQRWAADDVPNNGTVSEFYDGMTFTPEGVMVTDVLVDTARALRKLKREIGAYVKLYDDETVSRLIDDAANNGTAGDCFFCGMVTTDGQALGAATANHDHLFSHIEEGYVMASLIRNALKHCNYRDEQLPYVLRHGSIVRRSVRRYLVETLTTSHGARPMGRDGREVHWA